MEKDHWQEALDFLRKIRDSKYQFIQQPRLWFDVEGGGEDEFRKWIDAQDSRITKNKCHVVNTRKYTFGCDQVGLYEELEKEFGDDVVFVDRFRFDVEFGKISAIKGTRANYGFIGPKPGEVKVTKGGIKKYTLLVRSAPCGCKTCRNGDFEDCNYEGLRYTEEKHDIFKQNDDSARMQALIKHDDATSERWTWDGGLYPAVVDEPPNEEIGQEECLLPPALFSICFIIDGMHFDPHQEADLDIVVEELGRGRRVKRKR